jgi:hypothetical protein
MNKSRTAAPIAFEISGTETLRPTPDILDVLEKDYPLEASIADLVDNSIDARATKILVRLLKREGRLVSLCIADDGHGMNDKNIRQAMQFAARRDYGPKDLGMFGVGLKTASLSQADILTVVSRADRSSPVGRQWTKSGIKKHDWSLNVLTPKSAAHALGGRWGLLGSIARGTVVRWDDVSDFRRLHTGVDDYIDRAIVRIQHHLGLKLHRFLERGKLRIEIDVEDLSSREVGPPSIVSPTNPFPPKSGNGARGFPKLFDVHLPGGQRVHIRGHIWPKKSGDEGYKLGGGKVAEHQGFYFYRHERLIQDGGWCGIIGTNEPHLSLARVEVDIRDELNGYLKVRSNKAGVDVPASFADAVFESRAKDGTNFSEYTAKAQEVYRRRGEQKARPMLQPGSGVPSEVRAALERKNVNFLRGQGCSIAWETLKGSSFLRIDQQNRRLLLNKKFRPMLLRGAHGGKTDLPLLRTLLFFMFEGLLAGDRISAVERLRVDAVQSAIGAALKLERAWANK